MQGYLVTTIYSGALHISPMRIFETQAEAETYWDEISADDQPRMYLLSNDAPPKMIKLDKPRKLRYK